MPLRRFLESSSCGSRNASPLALQLRPPVAVSVWVLAGPSGVLKEYLELRATARFTPIAGEATILSPYRSDLRMQASRVGSEVATHWEGSAGKARTEGGLRAGEPLQPRARAQPIEHRPGLDE